MKFHKLFSDFKLVMWKNLVIKCRKPVMSTIELLIPILVCAAICMFVRLPVEHANIVYEGFTVDIEAPPITAILWSPCQNIFLKDVIQKVVQRMKIEEDCFASAELLDKSLQFSQGSKIVGVQFDDELGLTNTISGLVNITLRFEDKVDGYHFYWKTDALFPSIEFAGPREASNKHGGPPYYYTDGFLSLQHCLVEEIVRQNDEKFKMPTIEMQRFPYSSWVSYDSLYKFHDFVTLGLLFAFLNLFANTIRSVASEKESQVKEIMKIMGLTAWMNRATWFCTTLLTSIIPVAVSVTLLKVGAIYGSKSSVFPLTNGVVLFIFFLAYICSNITLAFVISAIFSQPITATVSGWIIFIVTILPYFLIQSASKLTVLISCLFSNTAFGEGVKAITHYEILQERLSFENLFSPATRSSTALGVIICILILDSVIYLLIAVYIEAVFPGTYGLPKVWYFPFTKEFWLGRPHAAKDSSMSEDDDIDHKRESWYEEEPADKKVKVKIIKLTKKFGKNKIILKDVSFNTFEDEITVITGYTGAGKSTIMCILAGILPPTSGTAIINGRNIKTNMTEIRRDLGFCPQSDVLWNKLTVMEHLYFFSRLKGISKEECRAEIETYLEVLELSELKNVCCRKLTKTMKRKLSIGIALCGKSKVCIFDNPTFGMDIVSKRKMWDFIKTQKEDRTILWSTNLIQEAEFLGDRIGILTNGFLRCYGTAAFLKKSCGSGYRLVIIKYEKANVSRISQMLRQHIPDLEVESNNPREVAYILQEKDSPIFEKMFAEMEEEGKDHGIHSFEIYSLTMEEVLMSVKVGVDIEHDEHYTSSVSEYVLTSNRCTLENIVW